MEISKQLLCIQGIRDNCCIYTLFTITSASVGAPAIEINLTIDADTTASMSFDTAVYDIEISDVEAENIVTVADALAFLEGKGITDQIKLALIYTTL